MTKAQKPPPSSGPVCSAADVKFGVQKCLSICPPEADVIAIHTAFVQAYYRIICIVFIQSYHWIVLIYICSHGDSWAMRPIRIGVCSPCGCITSLGVVSRPAAVSRRTPSRGVPCIFIPSSRTVARAFIESQNSICHETFLPSRKDILRIRALRLHALQFIQKRKSKVGQTRGIECANTHIVKIFAGYDVTRGTADGNGLSE